MKPFLEKLAEELYSRYREGISGIQVVFPSRRAGIYFKKHLSGLLKEPIWSPSTCGISDFIRDNSENSIADELTLIFELYEVYRELAEEVTFDKFYPWGEIILRDFDEIDKSLADADYLFRILMEHRKVEEDFEVKVSDLEQFYRFWDSFSEKDITDLQKEFIKTWEILGKVYKIFRARLYEKNLCYEGMAFRKLYENVRDNKFTTEYSNIVFAGFNQLNKCEEEIIKCLIKQGITQTYWDADKYYSGNKIQEAGKFLRENFVNLGINEPQWIDDSLSSSEINIKIIGSPLEVSQAKVLGSELEKLVMTATGKTAIVLPDDSFLMPVLRSIPPNIDAINITMGYSFRNSGLFSLFELLRDLNLNSTGKGRSKEYYHKDIIAILLHPYIRETDPWGINDVVSSINKRNVIYASAKYLKSFFKRPNILLEQIFTNSETTEDSYMYLKEIIVILSEVISGRKFSNVYESEFVNRAFIEVNRVKSVLDNYSIPVEKTTFWNILTEYTSRIKIPFSGEPLQGIQIMGMLETRSLDFENVFILSLNEGTLPRETGTGSFIPYSLRKAFRLPLSEDTEADYAYYFYRLLQKAKNVTLMYNTETGIIFSGEKSRFIMQLETELKETNKNISIESVLLKGNIELPKRREIKIEKTKEILERLKNQKQFSASLISNYINCSLQFYFKKAAGLKEEDEVEEYFSAADFGNIFHQLMEILYRNDVGTEITKDRIVSINENLENNYEELWKQACEELSGFSEFAKLNRGKNLLYKRVIKRLIGKVLESDSLNAPFKIIELESKATKIISVEINGEPADITLYGRLDRVEIKDGVTRIIDYKTGNVIFPNRKKFSQTELLEMMFNDVKLKEYFQQLFYASLYLSGNNVSGLIVGVYPLKKISDGVYWFEKLPITAEKMEQFESNLSILLKKIFDSTTPFTQTKDPEKCKYCPYKSICYRD